VLPFSESQIVTISDPAVIRPFPHTFVDAGLKKSGSYELIFRA
jgi:hypothetical protein